MDHLFFESVQGLTSAYETGQVTLLWIPGFIQMFLSLCQVTPWFPKPSALEVLVTIQQFSSIHMAYLDDLTSVWDLLSYLKSYKE